MPGRRPLPQGQHGTVLIEALVAILVFSVGILALIGLQALALKSSTDAHHRGTAAYLANQLVSEMWAADRSTLVAQYQTATQTGTTSIAEGSCLAGTAASGTRVTNWLAQVTNQMGGADRAPADRQQVRVTANVPIPPQNSYTYTVTVTVCWRQAQDRDNTYHNYVLTSLISS